MLLRVGVRPGRINKGRKTWENVETMLIMIVHKNAMVSRQLVPAGHAGGRNISSDPQAEKLSSKAG